MLARCWFWNVVAVISIIVANVFVFSLLPTWLWLTCSLLYGIGWGYASYMLAESFTIRKMLKDAERYDGQD